MKLLLDENLPKKLKGDFIGYSVFTVRDQGWNGVKYGELIQLMLSRGFDALITFDKNLEHQQNFQRYTVTIFVLAAINNTYIELSKLTSKILTHLEAEILPSGPIIIESKNTSA